ncbi:class I SAM-dependent methyltransferase [Pseudonocardia sp. GCM10023141]|uniref:class I SAM-dependent methyltransferase n=1 Tax=Pseudonocardia sp. GCM10023141 TaxID=3252653 RepID=UPI0036226207
MSALRCRFCSAGAGELVLDLGEQPACEYFPSLRDVTVDAVFPLRLWLCADCGLVQLADDTDLPDQPEGIEPTALTSQRSDAVAAAHAAGLLPAGATVAEGATPHGGSWATELAARGLVPVDGDQLADVVVDGSFGMMHATDQAAALTELVGRLAPDGVFLFQFHSLAAILREQQWNAVRLGHYAYYSVPVLQRMLADHGLAISNAWTFPLYGGTVLIAARRGGIADASVATTIRGEIADGVLNPAALRMLQHSVDTSTAALRALVEDATGAGQKVYGYSAASRAVALICLAGLRADTLLGVGDAAPAKHGCRMPGTTIPVLDPTALVAAKPDIVLMFVSDLLPEVRKALPEIESAGGRFVDPTALAHTPEPTTMGTIA